MGKKEAGDLAGLVIEMLQHGSEDLCHTLAMMFTAIIRRQADPPDAWKKS